MICDRFLNMFGRTWLGAVIIRNVLAVGEANMRHNDLQSTYGRYSSGSVTPSVQPSSAVIRIQAHNSHCAHAGVALYIPDASAVRDRRVKVDC